LFFFIRQRYAMMVNAGWKNSLLLLLPRQFVKDVVAIRLGAIVTLKSSIQSEPSSSQYALNASRAPIAILGNRWTSRCCFTNLYPSRLALK
jgi:hypothetical protein